MWSIVLTEWLRTVGIAEVRLRKGKCPGADVFNAIQ